jgi:hypothetical protein
MRNDVKWQVFEVGAMEYFKQPEISLKFCGRKQVLRTVVF